MRDSERKGGRRERERGKGWVKERSIVRKMKTEKNCTYFSKLMKKCERLSRKIIETE